MKKFWMAILGLTACATVTMAVEEHPFHVWNRFRVGYDDNIYRVSGNGALDVKESLRLIEEIETLLNLNYGATYLSIRYRPSVTWVEARDDDNFDVLHDLNVDFNHKFSRVLSLDLSDTLRAGQMPELHDGDYVVREDDDNYYNSAIAALMFQVAPKTRIDLSGRFISLTYTSDSEAKKYSDYITAVGGLTVRQQLTQLSSVMADFRYQYLSYDKNPQGFDRDAQMFYGGIGYEQTLSRYFIASLRGGVEQREYDEDDYDDNTQPYVEAALTFMPVEDFRSTLAASYSIYESDIANYMSQDRTYISASVAWDMTAKISLYGAVIYSKNQYEADYAKKTDVQTVLKDGDEDTFTVSTRLSYQVNRYNWLECNYQFLKLDSEIPGREEYDNNRVDVAWRIQLF